MRLRDSTRSKEDEKKPLTRDHIQTQHTLIRAHSILDCATVCSRILRTGIFHRYNRWSHFYGRRGGKQICFYRLYYSQYLIKLINLTKFDKAVKRQTMLAQIDCQRQMHMSRFMQSACRPYKQAYSYHDPSATASAKARWLVHCIAVILSDAWLHLAKL